ncbi:MAG: hypothetical protein JOZ96_01685 [Acidobacteria bacterium]|nr:hypothetical protein [Acidobacteriota bacterium]
MRRGMLLLFLTCALTGRVFAQTGTWTTVASTPTPIAQQAAGVINGRLYAVGGANAAICCNNFPAPTFEYDLATNSWVTKTTMSVKRKNLAGGVVNGLLYAVGGDDDFSYFTTNEAYDPVLDTWTGRGSMLTGRTGLAAGVVNGKLYATGGSIAPVGVVVATVEAHDPIANTWTARAPMLQPRTYHGAAAVNGKLYVVGGIDGNGIDLATVESYDPASDTWTSRAPMPTARHSFGIAVANGIIYAIGGGVSSGSPSVLSTVEAYNLATNTWTTAPSMPTARLFLSAGEINGVIYAVGGIDANSNFLDTVEAFTTSPPQASPPTSKDQCDNGGWRGFTVPRPFKNQGDCIRFVRTGR